MNQYEDKSKSPVVMSGELCSICGFGSEGVIGIYAGRSAFVGLKETMTALEVAYAIDTLSRIASDLTVVLADAAGLCNGCGELEGRTPAGCAAECGLCRDLLNGSLDEDGNGVEMAETEIRNTIAAMPADVVAVMKDSGVCLAALDECVMKEEIVYGE